MVCLMQTQNRKPTKTCPRSFFLCVIKPIGLFKHQRWKVPLSQELLISSKVKETPEEGGIFSAHLLQSLDTLMDGSGQAHQGLYVTVESRIHKSIINERQQNKARGGLN